MKSSNGHHILIFGAGLSAKGLFLYLSKHQLPIREITLIDQNASNLDEAKKILNDSNYIIHLKQDSFSEEPAITELFDKADIVVSLLPPDMHLSVVKLAVSHHCHFLNASYLSPELEAISKEMKSKNLVYFAECGLDPGLDHVLTEKLLDRCQDEGIDVEYLYSYCGGLPKRRSVNDFGYLFFWAPMNVLNAGKNGATWLEDGELKKIHHLEVFSRAAEIEGLAGYEVYPNRDSLHYIEQYGLKQCKTIKRGTIRYSGFCERWQKLIESGLLEEGEISDHESKTFKEMCDKLSLKDDFSSRFQEWLNSEVAVSGKTKKEWMYNYLLKQWVPKDEQDKVVLFLEAKGKNGKRSLYFEFEQVDSFSAMSLTVGYPLGVALKTMLEQRNLKGAYIPFRNILSKSMFEVFEDLGIKIKWA